MELYKKIVAIIITSIMMLVPVMIIILPQKDFSENENRVLQEFPEVSAKKIVSGEVNKKIESFMNDQFPLRDNLVSVKSSIQVMAGYKELNGAFVTKNRILQHIEKPNTDTFVRRMNKLSENLNGSNTNMYLMMVPTDADVYKEELPAYAPDMVDEKAVIKSIYDNVSCTTVDVRSALMDAKSNGNNLYYNLDHHWTYYGAYEGYKKYCEASGHIVKKTDSFDPERVTENFRGTLYSKALISTMKPDYILAPSLDDYNLSVEFKDMKKIKKTYYDETYLHKKDKYSYFGSGNQALIIIENKNANTNDELVIVKDSFANCMIPFLIGDYKKIHIIDPRYYMPHVSSYVKEQKNVKDVLVLYNVDSLNINSGIVKIK